MGDSGSSGGRGGHKSVVDQYFAGDRALFESYAAMCLEQFVRDVREGRRASGQRDVGGLERLGHSLKTVLQSLGQDDLAAGAALLERLAHAGDIEGALSNWQALDEGLERLFRQGLGS